MISKGEDRETKCSEQSSCKESCSYCMTPVSLDIRHFAADSSLFPHCDALDPSNTYCAARSLLGRDTVDVFLDLP